MVHPHPVGVSTVCPPAASLDLFPGVPVLSGTRQSSAINALKISAGSSLSSPKYQAVLGGSQSPHWFLGWDAASGKSAVVPLINPLRTTARVWLL